MRLPKWVVAATAVAAVELFVEVVRWEDCTERCGAAFVEQCARRYRNGKSGSGRQHWSLRHEACVFPSWDPTNELSLERCWTNP